MDTPNHIKRHGTRSGRLPPRNTPLHSRSSADDVNVDWHCTQRENNKFGVMDKGPQIGIHEEDYQVMVETFDKGSRGDMTWLAVALSSFLSLLVGLLGVLASASFHDGSRVHWNTILVTCFLGTGTLTAFILSFFFWRHCRNAPKSCTAWHRLSKRLSQAFKAARTA